MSAAYTHIDQLSNKRSVVFMNVSGNGGRYHWSRFGRCGHTLEARGVIFVKIKSGYYVAAPKVHQPVSKGLIVIDKPKLVNVPDVFYEIMERTAAFDIAPKNLDITQAPHHLLLLNRHLSRGRGHGCGERKG